MPIQTALGHLRAINDAYAEAVAGPIEDPGPVGQLVARLAAFGFRQVEGILVLVEAADHLHLQVAQVVRGIVEAWSQAAWLLDPEADEERLKRAVGLVSDGLAQHRSKLQYQDDHEEHLNPTPQVHWEALEAQETQLEELKETHGVEALPTAKKRMEDLGHYGRYLIYRWDSDAVHASTTGLGGLVTQTEDATVLGVAGHEEERMSRLVMAWEVASDLYELAAAELHVEMENWDALRTTAHDELLTLMEAYNE